MSFNDIKIDFYIYPTSYTGKNKGILRIKYL